MKMKQIPNSNSHYFGSSPSFPILRLRRLRRSKAIRDLLQETRLSIKDLICPIFVEEGLKSPKQITSIQDIQILPISKIVDEVEHILKLGINAIIIFGIPLQKDNYAKAAYDEKGIVQQSITTIKKNFGDKIAIISDVCMCQYTPLGHCGIVRSNIVDNDASIEILAKIASSHAAAGSDIVAPSSMMDGQVNAIRKRLDLDGFIDTSIMAYSAKLASPLYTPFRDIVGSYPEFGDRKTYQMPFTNASEALREIGMDIKEGADIIMIKPALPYLDLIYRAREIFKLPLCAYSVSGEYALIKAAADNGWINETEVMTEFITAIKRSGADIIITYYAKKMASLLTKRQ